MADTLYTCATCKLAPMPIDEFAAHIRGHAPSLTVTAESLRDKGIPVGFVDGAPGESGMQWQARIGWLRIEWVEWHTEARDNG